MAETVLVVTPLLDRLVSAGRELVDALEKDEFPLTAAFWLLDPDEEPNWKLFLAADGVRSEGLFKSYGRVLGKAPATPGVFWPSTIRIEDSTRTFIKSVRAAVKAGYSKKFSGGATVHLKSASPVFVNLYVYKV